MVGEYTKALCHRNICSLCFSMRFHDVSTSTNSSRGAGPCIHSLYLLGLCSPHRTFLCSLLQERTYIPLHWALWNLSGDVLYHLQVMSYIDFQSFIWNAEGISADNRGEKLSYANLVKPNVLVANPLKSHVIRRNPQLFENQEAFCYAIILSNIHASPAVLLFLCSTAACGKPWNWTADNITPLTNLQADGFLPETVFTEQAVNLER